MKADALRHGLVEEARSHSILDLRPQLEPTISFREDGLGKTLGDKTAVSLLCDFEDYLVHSYVLWAADRWYGKPITGHRSR
jgi:hypothetical protein